MKSDIEIARSIELKKIKQVAESVGIPREEVENYGRYIAKIPEHLIDEEKVKQSNLILESWQCSGRSSLLLHGECRHFRQPALFSSVQCCVLFRYPISYIGSFL